MGGDAPSRPVVTGCWLGIGNLGCIASIIRTKSTVLSTSFVGIQTRSRRKLRVRRPPFKWLRLWLGVDLKCHWTIKQMRCYAEFNRAINSVGCSTRLTSVRSEVRVLHCHHSLPLRVPALGRPRTRGPLRQVGPLGDEDRLPASRMRWREYLAACNHATERAGD